jgi:acetylornithine deacetylase/succinyl-diaminopimelate desuccinylase-like protein
MEWLAIPSVSTLREHKPDVQAAAEWLAARMTAMGLDNVAIIPTESPTGHPIVYGDWLRAGSDAATVLIYGHYDVQPVDPVNEWRTPPFMPTVDGDKLFARGASDDKGQTYIHLAAVEALLQSEGTLPVNVKFLIEGEEEVGSRGLANFVPSHADQLAADVCLISDTHILGPDQPSILYGLRGGMSAEVIVRGPQTDLHSGMFGGAVHNPNQALAELLASLHDQTGQVTIPGFYDDVLPLSAEERALLAQVPYDESNVMEETGVPAVWGEAAFTPVERIGARPTLEITGMWGGFIGEGFKTVIPREARAKISCRLVPDQDPVRIGQLLQEHLARIAPPTVTVEVQVNRGAPATVVDIHVPQMQAAVRAYETVFGATPIFTREGGSIPIAGMLKEVLDAPVIFMGFGLPDDNLHAPNEKLSLSNFYKGIRTSIVFLQELGGR